MANLKFWLYGDVALETIAINNSAPYCLLCFRIIFLGLITCLSGSSYFFIIAVIILLRRQFRKPQRETETQQPNVSKGIELKTLSNPTEGQPSAPKTPTQPHTPKAGRLSSINKPQEVQQPKTLTEATVEFTCLPSDGAKTEIEGLKPEEEVTEGNDQICTCGRREAEQSHTEGKNELEKKSTHSKETEGPQKSQNVVSPTGSNKSQKSHLLWLSGGTTFLFGLYASSTCSSFITR